jgi:arylsulfatase A-like enzyme
MKQLVVIILTFLGIINLSAQEKPNILIIHTDDLGYHDLSCTGSELYNTPNIDKLATESVTFTNAYASYPRCVPSRYGMMTATYPINENKGHLEKLPESKNFIKQFKKAGYKTYYVGKWHLGENSNSLKDFGFTDSYGAGRSGGIGSRFYPFNTQKNGKPAKEPVEDLEEDGRTGDYASDMLTDKTIEYIKTNPKDKPFLAIIAFYAVHTPLEGKPEDVARNKAQLKNIDFGDTPEYINEGAGRRKMRQDHPDYAAMVENVDENVNRLLKTLKDMGIEDNTIIVFSSDHGGLSNDGYKGQRELATTNLPLRAGKGWLYEGGIRVPLFVKWGNNFKPHQDDKSIIMGMDVFPTLLDLALNQKINDVDGKSYAIILKGLDSWENRTVFWHKRKARPHSTGDYNSSVVRLGDYKLLHFYEDNRVELYNVKEEISESNDLSKKMPKKTAELMKELNKWKADYLVKEKMNIYPPKNKKENKKAKEN